MLTSTSSTRSTTPSSRSGGSGRTSICPGNFKVPVLALDTDVLPVEDFAFNPVVYFTIGTMMLRDDEFIVDGRAMALINKATGQLLGAAA